MEHVYGCMYLMVSDGVVKGDDKSRVMLAALPPVLDALHVLVMG